jgi:hypothetical protein
MGWFLISTSLLYAGWLVLKPRSLRSKEQPSGKTAKRSPSPGERNLLARSDGAPSKVVVNGHDKVHRRLLPLGRKERRPVAHDGCDEVA